jgi:hypothetical protein
MDASSVFSFGNIFVLLGWILLFFLPNWKHTQTLVLSGIVILLAIIYSFMILRNIGDLKAESFGSLASVKALFQNDNAVAAGWLHYLAFDLFVGAYIVRKSRSIGISRWLVSLALPFTFMFGPMGYLIFFVIKSLNTKSLAS